MKNQLLASLAIVAFALALVPTTTAMSDQTCTINLGNCFYGGACLVNEGTCSNQGSCLVNTGVCDGGACTVNLDKCSSGKP